jgi:hypothetical protein
VIEESVTKECPEAIPTLCPAVVTPAMPEQKPVGEKDSRNKRLRLNNRSMVYRSVR